MGPGGYGRQQLIRFHMKLSSAVPLALALLPSLTLAQAPVEPTPHFEFQASGSFTGEGDADLAGTTPGTLETRIGRAGLVYHGSMSEVLQYRLGAHFSEVRIDATAGIPLPDRLQSASAELGLTWNVDRAWTLIAMAQPGVHSDTEASSSDGFDVPVIALAQWRQGSWTFGAGARFSTLARNRAIPIAFARWQPSARWSFSLGAPRTEAAYKATAGTVFFAGASFEGGAFAVDDPALTAPAGYPSLRDTKLDYREIRVGAGVRHSFSSALRLQLEAGAAVDRRFEYFDRSLKIEADGAAFVALSFVGSF